MTKKYLYLCLCLMTGLSVLSCSDVFELDLEAFRRLQRRNLAELIRV